MIHISLLNNKYEVIDVFKVFKAKIEKQCEKQFKIIRTNRVVEYYGRYIEDGQTPNPFVKFLKWLGIVD